MEECLISEQRNVGHGSSSAAELFSTMLHMCVCPTGTCEGLQIVDQQHTWQLPSPVTVRSHRPCSSNRSWRRARSLLISGRENSCASSALTVRGMCLMKSPASARRSLTLRSILARCRPTSSAGSRPCPARNSTACPLTFCKPLTAP